jgi:hypothetical protein
MNPATAWLSSSFAQNILRQKKHLQGNTDRSDRGRVRDATEGNQKGKQSDESQGNAQKPCAQTSVFAENTQNCELCKEIRGIREEL